MPSGLTNERTPLAATPKTSSDNFLAEAVHGKDRTRIGYVDGFRFGFGFFIAGLLIALILGGGAWAAVILLHIG
jgi:hypothetical protein